MTFAVLLTRIQLGGVAWYRNANAPYRTFGFASKSRCTGSVDLDRMVFDSDQTGSDAGSMAACGMCGLNSFRRVIA